MRLARATISCWFALSVATVSSSPALAAVLERGPYLQQATPTSITVRWRTDVVTDAVVRFGTTSAALDNVVVGNQSGIDHEVIVTGLAPATLYYYSVGDSTETLAGNDPAFTFRSSPSTGTRESTRIWVIGDSGTADSDARAVRDAYLSYSGNRPADLWLMLGDNAYSDGTDAEYQDAVFDTYPSVLRNTPLWTTLGNHDGHTADSDTEQGPYYDIFTLPRNAEAGGLASGTEAYYSFDHGNIHFISLDSYDTDRSVGGAMLTWLENDLASTTQEWLIAFWHHPPYSKGSHDSDSEGRLADMRERVLPILESYGVDLVLSGHSHSYERSFLIDGHYGTSDTFSSSMLIDGGSGREDATGAYEKTAFGSPNQGAVYAVAGSSGKTSSGPLDHAVMFFSLRSLGSMILDVNGDRLDAAFIDDNGMQRDYFTMRKGANGGDSESPSPVSNLAATDITATSLTLSWQAATDNVGVTAYRVSRDGSVVVSADVLTFDDTNLMPNTTYSYSVVALDAAGNASMSMAVSVSTLAAADVDAPSPVTNLVASTTTSNSVTLMWDAASDNVAVTSYRVARDSVEISTANVLTFIDNNLTPNTTYMYTVVAIDAAGNESAPTTIIATTGNATSFVPFGGGSGAVSLVGLLLLTGLLVIFRARELRAAIRVLCVVLLLSAPLLAASHEDTRLQLEAVSAQLAENPGDHRLHAKRAALHVQHTDWQLALMSFRRAQALAPDAAAAIFDLRIAETLYLSGEANQALPYVVRYLNTYTKSSAGWRIHAKIKDSLHDPDAALASFARAIEFAKTPTPDLFFERGRLLERHPNRIDELLAGIDEGVQTLGPLMAFLEYAIDIECQRKNYAGALARLDALPEQIRQQPRWLLRRSLVLEEMGHHAEAERVNRLALQAIEDLSARRRNTDAYIALRSEIETSYGRMTGQLTTCFECANR